MTKYTLPELPYDPAGLEPHYSGDVIELHHGEHHASLVADANATLEKLEQARAGGEFDSISQLEKDLAFNVSEHLLHSMFWKNMNPDGGDKPTGALADAMNEHFGSHDAFQAQMTHAANTIEGSGWAVLAWEPLGSRLFVEQLPGHQNKLACAAIPLLVLDMWEHAFYGQYKNEKGAFVKAFWNIVNWDDVSARFESVRGTDLLL